VAADVAERSDALGSRTSALLSSCICTYHILRATCLPSIHLEAINMYATKSVKIEPGLDEAATSSDTKQSGEPFSTSNRIAAREFYDTPELRQLMLGLLEKDDLTNFMRVEQDSMTDVSRELYRTMDYAFVRNKMSTSTVSPV
jgi:hypothetical protein